MSATLRRSRAKNRYQSAVLSCRMNYGAVSVDSPPVFPPFTRANTCRRLFFNRKGERKPDANRAQKSRKCRQLVNYEGTARNGSSEHRSKSEARVSREEAKRRPKAQTVHNAPKIVSVAFSCSGGYFLGLPSQNQTLPRSRQRLCTFLLNCSALYDILYT